MINHNVEERRCTRRRVPTSFSHKEETRPLCGARAGPAKHLGITRAGDSCRSISSLAPHAPHKKNKGDARRTRHSFLSIYGYQGC
ncbi:hypothetical protein [Aneurinibacillus aneurinilyticus]|uniref:hypothetical protein n=1 Tax=Aneurinibacillus aneurinilyticus TaxID=1391 RepID=UPI003525F8C0